MKFIEGKRGWRIEFQTKTGRKTISTGEQDLDKAKAVAKAANIEGIEMSRKIELVANAAAMYALLGRKMTSEQAYNEWCVNLEVSRSKGTCKRYEEIVRCFLKKCGWPEVLSAILKTHIYKWLNNPEYDNHLATRNVHKAALQHFFQYCENEGWCRNPVANVVVDKHALTLEQKETKVRRPFTQDEFEKLVAVAKQEPMPYWYGALMIARYTGMRWSDVEEMETASIIPDPAPGHIVVWTRKRNKRIDLPMPPELPEVFDMLAKHTMNQPSFAPRPGKVFQRVPIDTLLAQYGEFHRLLEKAGVPHDLCLHSLRYTYATETAKLGLGLREIARRLGHFGENTTLGYLRALLLP
jgi:site-specific recombinase XerD